MSVFRRSDSRATSLVANVTARFLRSISSPQRRPVHDAAAGEAEGDHPQLSRALIERGGNGFPLDISASLLAILDLLPEPLFIIGAGGDYVHQNKAASALLQTSGFHANGSARGFFESLRVVNGGGAVPWQPGSVEVSSSDLLAFAGKLDGEKIYKLRSGELSGDGPSSGWLVQLTEITPLAVAMKGQAEAVRHRDQLVSLLSHDMRTPLVSIITTLAHPDFKTVPESLRQIVEQASRRGLRMVDSVVRLVRAESTAYNFAPIELSHIVEEAIDLVWQASSDANIRVELRPSEQEFVVSIDRGLMIQVFTSLLNTMIAHGTRGSLVATLTGTTLASRNAVSCRLSATNDARPGHRSDSMDSVLTSADEQANNAAVDADDLAFATAVVSRHHGVLRHEAAREAGGEIILCLPLVER